MKTPEVLVLIFLLSSMFSCCFCREFFVGGADGWISDPSANYTLWASQNRFRVNDILVFNYWRKDESVLVVDEEKYHFCDTSDPTAILQGGHNVFHLDRSGAFHFITNDMILCKLGQKLQLTVMAQKLNKCKPLTSTHSPSPSPSLSPASSPSSPHPRTKKPSPHHHPHPKHHHHKNSTHRHGSDAAEASLSYSSVSPSPGAQPPTQTMSSSAPFVPISFFWVLIVALRWI